MNICTLLHPGRVNCRFFLTPTNTVEFVTLAWDFEPGSAVIVHYSTKNEWVAKISYIIYVTSIIHPFCHFSAKTILDDALIRFSRTRWRGNFYLCNIYKLDIRLCEKRRCFAAYCCYKVRNVECILRIKLLETQNSSGVYFRNYSVWHN